MKLCHKLKMVLPEDVFKTLGSLIIMYCFPWTFSLKIKSKIYTIMNIEVMINRNTLESCSLDVN